MSLRLRGAGDELVFFGAGENFECGRAGVCDQEGFAAPRGGDEGAFGFGQREGITDVVDDLGRLS
jgi:hypothetical protein